MQYFPVPVQLEKIIAKIPYDRLDTLDQKHLYPFSNSKSIPNEGRAEIENKFYCDVYFNLIPSRAIEHTAHNIWIPHRGVRGEWVGIQLIRYDNGKGEKLITAPYFLNNYCCLKVFQALRPKFDIELLNKYNVESIIGRRPTQLKTMKLDRFLKIY